ncbi:MAG: acyltransferase [Hyphomicrobiaceae bacterium]
MSHIDSPQPIFTTLPSSQSLSENDRPDVRNPQIDGWRGLSVMLVITGHFLLYRFEHIFPATPWSRLLGSDTIDPGLIAWNALFRVLSALPNLGVQIFFVISGYIITTLLMREELRHGAISIKAFYVRRAARILPPFFIYLAAVYVLSRHFGLSVPGEPFLRSATFLCHVPGSCSYFLGHTWTLSIEEQYYVVWPMAFVLLRGRWRLSGLRFALASLTVASIWSPVASGFAHIATGALIALSPQLRQCLIRNARWPAFALTILVVSAPPFAASSQLLYGLARAISPLAIAFVFYATISGHGPFVRLVSLGGLQRLGLVSYSLYLWQQLSAAKLEYYDGAPNILLFPALFIVPAVLSYALVERPMMRAGRRISDSIRVATPPAAANAGEHVALEPHLQPISRAA